VQTGKPLVIVAEDVEGEALRHPRRQPPARWPQGCAVKAPGFGDRRKAMLQDHRRPDRRPGDLEDLGIKLENVTLAMLGRAKKVMIDKENTTIVNGAGKKARHRSPRFADQGAESRKPPRTTTVRSCRSVWQARRRRPVIRVGGATEIEVKERKDRVDDAMHATRAAV